MITHDFDIEPGLTEPSGDCNAGYYCVSKNTEPTPNEDVVGRPCDRGKSPTFRSLTRYILSIPF